MSRRAACKGNWALGSARPLVQNGA
jgi:hypothetical protein